MKLNYAFYVTALSLFSTVTSFSMDKDTNEIFNPTTQHLSIQQQDFDRVEFVKSFVPKNSSEEYIQKVADCYRDTLIFKKEIMHDDRPNLFGKSMILPNMVVKDYGWTFPSVPRVQKHLLEFCAHANQPLNMMDIGAGYGLDSLFALLTKNIQNLYAFEKQKEQTELLKQVVQGSIHTNVDPNFSLAHFKALSVDFLTFSLDRFKGKWDVLNANKVIHFFNHEETKNFAERASTLLKQGGRLFLTCLTPTPGSLIENFMNSQTEDEFPGYIFYKLQTELINGNQPGESQMLEVRKPNNREESAHFFQRITSTEAVTDRVMHYHTAETLTRLLGNQFSILETIITTPEENHGTDHMISIVAEKM